MPNYERNARRLALAFSITLHAGLAAWIAWPRASLDLPLQQVVEVNVVMISSLAQEPQAIETPPTEASSPPMLIKETAKKQSKPTVSQKRVSKQAQQLQTVAAATLPTTGAQSPNATETVAAITEPVFNAAYLHNTPPAYPEEAQRDGIEGKVLLDVAVTQQGNAGNVSIKRSSGHILLDSAARNAVRMWRFIPAKRGDEIVEARVIVPVEFRLN